MKKKILYQTFSKNHFHVFVLFKIFGILTFLHSIKEGTFYIYRIDYYIIMIHILQKKNFICVFPQQVS